MTDMSYFTFQKICLSVFWQAYLACITWNEHQPFSCWNKVNVSTGKVKICEKTKTEVTFPEKWEKKTCFYQTYYLQKSCRIFSAFNSYAWGMILENHLTFKVIFGSLLTVLSPRPKMFIPVFETFTAFVFFRFFAEDSWTEKKIISHRPIGEFRQKIEFEQL